MTTSAWAAATISTTVSSSIGRFTATMPPNAERRSQSNASWYARARVSATAAPQGLACFTITHAARSVPDGVPSPQPDRPISWTSCQAASAS
jgi:hypothetical protein